MTNRIPLIVNAGAGQIQEIAASDTLQVPGTLTANVVQTDNYQYANGQPFSGGGSGNYGNSNVQALLNSGAFTGNFIPNGNATQSLGSNTNQWLDLWVSNATIYLNSIPLGVSANGVLQFDGNDLVTSGPNVVNTGNVETTGNVIGGNIAISAGGSLQFADGSVQTTAYGNANVEAYLPNSNTIIAINSNVANTDGNVANLNSTVANLATTSSLANTNSNVANLTTSLANTDSALGNLTVTVTSQGNAIANLQAGAYSNANVADYLPTYTGDFSANNIVTTGNANITGYVSTGNLIAANVDSLGKITAGTFETIAGNMSANYVNANVDLFAGNAVVSNSVVTIDLRAFNSVTANFLIGNGSNISNINGANVDGAVALATNANVANVAYSVDGANVVGEVALANTVSNPIQANITGLGTITSLTANAINVNGQFTANGNAQFNQDVYFAGNVSIPGNIIQISGNSGSFFGNAITGFGALYAGLPAGYTLLNNEVVQFSDSYDGYTQVSHRNINGGAQATTDYVATADNGTDTTNYVDLGVAGSGYDGLLANNSLGTSLYPNDGYLYARGNVSGGNLVLGSAQANGVVRIVANGVSNINDVVTTFSSSGITLPNTITFKETGNAYLTLDRFGITANTQMVLSAANAQSGNNSSILFDKNGGGIILRLETNVGPSQASWSFYSGNLTFPDGSSQTTAYGNANVSALLSSNTVTTVSATGNITSGNYLLGNGYYIPNVNAVQVVNGTSNVTVPTTNGNVVVTVAGTATSTFDTAGNFSIPGNVITPHGMLAEGNIYTESWLVANNQGVVATQVNAGNISATGNITGNYIIGDGSLLTGLPAGYSNSNVVTLLTSYGSNVISTTGNVTAGYVIGDGSLLTSLPAPAVTYDNTSNGAMDIMTYDGNIKYVSTATIEPLSGNISTTGNVTAGYYYGDGSNLTGVGGNYGDSNVVTLLGSFGSNTISTTGNVSTGNIVTGGGTGGNITGVNIMSANVFIGDGGNLTNLPSSGLVVNSMTSGANITASVNDTQYNVTALAESATVTAPTGVAQDGQKLTYRIIDNGSAQTLSWDAIYTVIGTTLPVTTVAGKYVYVGVIYNEQEVSWDVVSVAQQS